MIPAQFDYAVAGSVDEAIAMLAENEDNKLLAGGHSLLPLMKTRLARPAKLIDIGRIDALRGVSRDGDHLVIGAMTTQADLATDALVREHCAIVAIAAEQVGDPQVRHMGTLGGSLAHADPASDQPTVMLALDAEMVARGPGGERRIPAAEFFQGFFASALAPDELLTAIRVPVTDGAGAAYLKFTQRALDWAIVGVAAVVRSSGGTVQDARIALTNMGTVPVRASAAEAALAGASGDAIAAACARAGEGTDPPSDTFAGADYRVHLAGVLTERAVRQAMGG
ncbi:MAG: xanthine dehydrogenase family protein subunit M [Thermoleophilia bacterium]